MCLSYEQFESVLGSIHRLRALDRLETLSVVNVGSQGQAKDVEKAMNSWQKQAGIATVDANKPADLQAALNQLR